MATSSLTLYEIEESLQALLDSEALITPEQEAEFLAELGTTLRTKAEKVDRYADFIHHCEMLADTAKVEQTRLREREEFFERTAERVRGYACHVIEGMGRDGRGKWRKLEGKLNTFSLRANPAHVEIEDATAVPAEFKTVTITVGLERLEDFLATVSIESDWVITIPDGTVTMPLSLWQAITAMTFWLNSAHSAPEVSKKAIRAAIEALREVPGASLKLGGNRVEIT